MNEYLIEMVGEKRSDGSVLISSPELPMFSAIGENEKRALEIALRVLEEYLAANVPDFVQLRVVPPASEIISWSTTSDSSSSMLPAHVIATMKGRVHATSGSTDS
jgi:hypothetical protein